MKKKNKNLFLLIFAVKRVRLHTLRIKTNKVKRICHCRNRTRQLKADQNQNK